MSDSICVNYNNTIIRHYPFIGEYWVTNNHALDKQWVYQTDTWMDMQDSILLRCMRK